MVDNLLIKNYREPEFNIGEILHYAGCSGGEYEILNTVKLCITECKELFTYSVCYRELPIKTSHYGVNFSFMTVNSRSLKKNLEGCSSAVVFAATVGLGIDRLIAKYGKISPSRAVIFQAIGAERIESLCNVFNSEITESYRELGFFTRPRFSPGYGDFPLICQKNIFDVLDCSRKIGLTLNDSLLMSPSKSVTAVIGIGQAGSKTATSRCSECENKSCNFRRNG